MVINMSTEIIIDKEKEVSEQDITVQNVNKKYCTKCGAAMDINDIYCAKCGSKCNVSSSSENSGELDDMQPKNKKGKRIVILIITVALVVVTILACAVIILPNIFISVDDCLKIGDYQKAYSLADTDEEKDAVMFENYVAVESAEAIDSLKDPSSFVLRDAYYNDLGDDLSKNLVLKVNATNSYGGNVTNYWLYSLSTDSNSWKLTATVSDLEQEEIYSFDDYEEEKEKTKNNAARYIIEFTMISGTELKKDGVQRINNIFKEDNFESIKPIETGSYENLSSTI